MKVWQILYLSIAVAYFGTAKSEKTNNFDAYLQTVICRVSRKNVTCYSHMHFKLFQNNDDPFQELSNRLPFMDLPAGCQVLGQEEEKNTDISGKKCVRMDCDLSKYVYDDVQI